MSQPDADRTDSQPPTDRPGADAASDPSAARTLDCAADDVARVVDRLSESDLRGLLDSLSDARAAELLRQVPQPLALRILEALPDGRIAPTLDDLGTHDQTVLLNHMSAQRAEAVVDERDPARRAAIDLARTAPKGAIGELIDDQVLTIRADRTIGQVLSEIDRAVSQGTARRSGYLYVTDDARHLVGVLPLYQAVFSDRNQIVRDLMTTDLVSLGVDDELRSAEDAFERLDLFQLPVVDKDGQLVGVVHRSDIEEGLGDQTEDAYRKALGIVGGEELRSMPFRVRFKRRGAWLVVNIGMNLFGATVLALFQGTIEAWIALAVFLPIISDMAANAGTQALAVTMRELSLGLLGPGELTRVIAKESLLGGALGLLVGVIVGTGAAIFDSNAVFGLIVGTALAATLALAVLIGGTVPLVVKRFGGDPALAAGPILTTITDVIGFVLTLGGASIVLMALNTP